MHINTATCGQLLGESYRFSMKREADTWETGKCAYFTWHDGAQISQYILRWSCMRRDVLRNNKKNVRIVIKTSRKYGKSRKLRG